MYTQFKLSACSLCCDRQDPVKVGVIIGLAGAYQARNSSQSPPFELFCDVTKVEKQLPTRTAKTDDALTKIIWLLILETVPFSARGATSTQSATSDPFNTHLLGSSVDFAGSPLWNLEG